MLKKMRYVYTVYEEKSFSKAAEKLFVSQPSLSSMVKKVETSYGITIFDRTTNPISLTPEGEYYIRTVEKILKLEDGMRQHLRECSNGFVGNICFGGASFFCTVILSGLIKQFCNEYPNIRVDWLEMRNDELISQILQRKIDFALEVDRFEASGIDSLRFGVEEVILAVPAAFSVNDALRGSYFRPGSDKSDVHSIFDLKPVGIELFRDIPFVFLREGNDSYTRGLNICRNAGFEPNITMLVDSSMTCYRLAAAGNGAAFIRSTILSVEPSSRLCYYRIDDPLSIRDIMLYFRDDGRSAAENTLLSFIKDRIGQV